MLKLIMFLINISIAEAGFADDYQWGAWIDIGCSSTCGSGEMTMIRFCNHPFLLPIPGTDFYCKGDRIKKTVSCAYDCPVDGKWGEWISWIPCSVTCGIGTRTKYRYCNNPMPSNGGTYCQGNETETEACLTRGCLVDGQWGPWIDLSPCSVTRGNGTRTKLRFCNNPRPSNGGTYCQGDDSQTVSCSNDITVNGQWTEWIRFPCSVTCDNGTRNKYRFCANPMPSNGGTYCQGDNKEGETCSEGRCTAIDGQWTEWIQFPCSVTCGNGTRNKFRVCSNPTPSNGGLNCQGNKTETETCSLGDCPENGQWGEWSSVLFDKCSARCGNGTMIKYRSCTNPTPLNPDQYCQGNRTKTEKCSTTVVCPVRGQWSAWIDIFPCSVTCGVGTRTRYRYCNNPMPSNMGSYCQDDDLETYSCLTTFCPDKTKANNTELPRSWSSTEMKYYIHRILIGVLIIIFLVGILFGVYGKKCFYACGCLKTSLAPVHVTAVTGSLDGPLNVATVTGSSDDTSLNYPPPPYGDTAKIHGAAKNSSPPPRYSSLDLRTPPPSYSSLQSSYKNTRLKTTSKNKTNVVAYRNNTIRITVKEK